MMGKKERLTERFWVKPSTARRIKRLKAEKDFKSIDDCLNNLVDEKEGKKNNGFKFPKI